ncbi:MAG: hypothetical protein Q4D50_03285 [Eubacteriales bacterium]|nr:hypothetical protein [Eubacteriales bacterium]
MIVKHKLTMDLAGQAGMPRAEMVEGDQYARQLELSLYCGAEPWSIPEDVHAVVSFRRADGTGGEYDTLGGGTPAWTAEGHVLTVDIAPQVLTVAGPVLLSVALYRGSSKISTFAILLSIQQAVLPGQETGGTLEVTGFLRGPETAAVGQYFRVAAVDDYGAVTRVEAVTIPNWEEAVNEALAQAEESGAFRGQSAYELAVENGFEGTQDEWLESLRGGLGSTAELGDVQQINITGTLTTDAAVLIHFHNTRLQGVRAPVEDSDAATKGYADKAARDAAASYLVPGSWQTAVEAAVQTVTALQDAGGRNCVSFAYLSDCHAVPGNTSFAGHLAAAVMDRCRIPFALMCGDAAAAGTDSEAQLRQSHTAADEMLAPIGWRRLLQVQGEADGAWNGGSLDAKALYGTVFRKLAEDSRRIFGGDGSYYYLDDPAAKIRFIVLNSSGAGDGFGYGNAQLNWLASMALSFEEEDWDVVLAAHVSPASGLGITIRDDAVLKGILRAFHWGQSYSGTAGTAGQGDYVSVSCDYTGRTTARIIGFFAGHTHQDGIVADELPCAAVTIASTAAEPVMDFVTVNRESGHVFLTRLGTGRDRIYAYGGIPYLLYRVTSHLTNCTTSSSVDLAEEQDYYHTELVPLAGYTLSSVTVTMGGEDITAQCYDSGVIDIFEVTGDVVVTAIAQK